MAIRFRSSSSEIVLPSLRTTARPIPWLYVSSSTAKETASPTAGFVTTELSSLSGLIFSPPLLMNSLILPVMMIYPLWSFLPLVACSKKSFVRKRCLVGFGIVEVAFSDVLAPYAYLCLRALGDILSCLIENPHLNPLPNADATRAPIGRW